MNVPRLTFIRDIQQLLGCDKQTARRTVNAIFSSMTEALLRGETVKVNGLGKFSIQMKQGRRFNCYFFKWGAKSIIDRPDRKKVIFTPVAGILEELNNTR